MAADVVYITYWDLGIPARDAAKNCIRLEKRKG